jgi:type I restriction enzyme, S subunit
VKASLAQVTELLTDGTHYTPPNVGRGVPFLTVKDVSENGLDFENCSQISRSEYETAARQNSAPKRGDVLFSKDGTVGKVHLVREDREFAVLSSLAILRPASDLDAAYLAHFLRTPAALDAAAKKKTGSAIRRIVLRDLATLEIPLPPLPEQRRIAAILDMATAQRRRRKRAIELLDSLTPSIFLDIFGDPVTNPKRFAVRRLGEVGRLDRGVSKHRPRNAPILLGGEHPLIQTGDVANSGGYIRSWSQTYSDFGLKQSKKWPAGTLCITIAANIAQTGILTFSACFPDSVVGYSHERSGMVEYVRVWLSFLRTTLERTAPAVAQKNINLEILRNLTVAVPPPDPLDKFGSHMDKLQNLRNREADAYSREALLLSSLQYRAFSGQL